MQKQCCVCGGPDTPGNPLQKVQEEEDSWVTRIELEEEDESGLYVHLGCAHRSPSFGTCIFCGDHIIHPIDRINEAGECPTHRGESFQDADERADWDSYLENLRKDGN